MNSQPGRRRFLSALAIGALCSTALARKLHAGETTIASPQFKSHGGRRAMFTRQREQMMDAA